MNAFRLSTAIVILFTAGFAGHIMAEEAEVAVPLEKLPKAVTAAVKKAFSKATLVSALQKKEDGETLYEVTVKENGKRIEITLEEDGEIEEIEKEIDLKDLPKAVTDALKAKFPQATLKSAEAEYDVDDGKQELESYEVKLVTADQKKVEAKVKPDGTIVSTEDDGEDKKSP